MSIELLSICWAKKQERKRGKGRENLREMEGKIKSRNRKEEGKRERKTERDHMNSAREQSTSERERVRCYLQQEIFIDKKK